jgi:hypothetical protein
VDAGLGGGVCWPACDTIPYIRALSTTVYAYPNTPVGTYEYAAMGLQSVLPASTTFELVR